MDVLGPAALVFVLFGVAAFVVNYYSRRGNWLVALLVMLLGMAAGFALLASQGWSQTLAIVAVTSGLAGSGLGNIAYAHPLGKNKDETPTQEGAP